jgi:hypothetical protein
MRGVVIHFPANWSYLLEEFLSTKVLYTVCTVRRQSLLGDTATKLMTSFLPRNFFLFLLPFPFLLPSHGFSLLSFFHPHSSSPPLFWPCPLLRYFFSPSLPLPPFIRFPPAVYLPPSSSLSRPPALPFPQTVFPSAGPTTSSDCHPSSLLLHSLFLHPISLSSPTPSSFPRRSTFPFLPLLPTFIIHQKSLGSFFSFKLFKKIIYSQFILFGKLSYQSFYTSSHGP